MHELMTVLLTILMLSAPVPVSATENRPALWAVYYAWYQTDGKASMWTLEQTAEPRSKAQPLIGYYDSDDPEVVRWHIRLAKAAGIDAFLVSWWGGANISGKTFDEVILPIAAEEDFKVALCSELAQLHHDVKVLTGQTSDVLRKTKDSPAYLRVDGKPVAYLYQVPFAPKLTPETFDQLCRGVEAEIGPVYWIMDKVTNAGDQGLNFPDQWLKMPETAMFGFYGTFSIKRIWKYEDLAPDYERLVQQAHAAGKKVFLPVHPGHDNSGFRPNDFFVIPRDGGATLRGYLRAATDAGVDAILVTSFNEWPETTVVEPSSSWKDPYLYLKIVAEWKGREFAPPPRPEPRSISTVGDFPAPPPGLVVAPDGRLRKDGRPYRGVGANYFDLLIRLLHHPTNTSSLDGLERLGKAGIPFVRFAVAYGDREWKLFLNDREEFFRRFDLVVRAAERANVGLIPSIFWHFIIFPDLVEEPRDQWGNPDSRTNALMCEVTRAIVERYKDSPAIWAWEFGNEPNLMADLPNAAQFRKPGGTERDDLTSAAMIRMLTEFAREVRRHDAHRPIFAGHSHPRASAWHNTAEKSWTADSREQTLEILRRDNPSPLNTIGIHVYGDRTAAKELAAWATDHAGYLQAVRDLARELKRPVFVGEFGLAEKDDPAAARAGFEQLLAAMEAADIDLAAFWVFDLKSQDKTWNVTFDNDRDYMLELTAKANRRWNQAAQTNGRR